MVWTTQAGGPFCFVTAIVTQPKMADEKSTLNADDSSALKQVNRSGYPFQLKVEYDIRSSEKNHHWCLLEAIAKELLEATEGLAQEEIAVAQSVQESHPSL